MTTAGAGRLAPETLWGGGGPSEIGTDAPGLQAAPIERPGSCRLQQRLAKPSQSGSMGTAGRPGRP